jgi:type II secretory ATPase GspE/PulE/Tfp pilus assembly ATPase PilB-like protein
MLVREKVERASQMNYEAIFSLIDSLLPFEACLYHQILPLSIEGSLLRLGVVEPQDASGVDYARRMLAYLNCSLVTEEISCETQRSVLSAYLYHKGQNKSHPPTQISNPQNKEKAKEVPASSEDLSAKESAAKTQSQGQKEREPNSQARATSRPPLNGPKPPQRKTTPELELEAVHLSSSVEALVGLEPKQLLEELLARVLLGGIGRLYFERQESGGNILCSQDGILQSVVEELEASKFEGVINELKLLTNMPLTPVEKPQQVEIERMYEGNELLLRLRVMPVRRGEEATLQVLRGAALRFYQQQQLSHLSRDALSLAEQLHGKVNQIRDRTRLVPKSKLENLPVLDKLLKDVEQEIKSILGRE